MAPSGSSKYILRELSLIRLYVVLLISFCYFLLQMFVAHVAHSLIIQVDAYHMLYNMLSLITSIITTKKCRKDGPQTDKVKNTFGWTRIDVCGAVAGICFLAALGFSVVIECLQSMLHAEHHEKMTMPMYCLFTGAVGLLVNSAAWVIIGGYTQQQKGFLESHREGTKLSISPSARRGPGQPVLECGGPLETLRDFYGCVLVIGVSLAVQFWHGMGVDMVDPMTSIFAVFVLGILSYEYAREAGYMLLLTIPNDIDVESLMNELFEKFPEIIDVHEFHIWQLNPSRIIATAHVVLPSMTNYWVMQNNIIGYLEAKGITHVTLQPEFAEVQNVKDRDGDGDGAASPATLRRRQSCFLPCEGSEECHAKKCCISNHDAISEASKSLHHGHSHEEEGRSHWSWKNPFRSKSNPNVTDSNDHLRPPLPILGNSQPNLRHSSENDSLPNTSLPADTRRQSATELPSHNDSSSSDDEESEIRKPMMK